MTTVDAFLRAWVAQALEKLDAANPGEGPLMVSDYAVNERWGVEIYVTRRQTPHLAGDESPISPAENRPEIAQANAGNDSRLTPLMRRILGALSADLQSRNRLANLCDHDNDSHFGKSLRRLITLGYAVKVGFSYRLPTACRD